MTEPAFLARRGQARRAALAPLLAVVAALAAPAYARELPQPVTLTGLSARLHDESAKVTRAGTPMLRWRSYWVLRWDNLPGAAGYEIVYLTAEGLSRKRIQLRAPPLKLEVAKGENPVQVGMPTRDVQLQTIQSLLAVQIHPIFTDGRRQSPSPWLAVGRDYP